MLCSMNSNWLKTFHQIKHKTSNAKESIALEVKQQNLKSFMLIIKVRLKHILKSLDSKLLKKGKKDFMA